MKMGDFFRHPLAFHHIREQLGAQDWGVFVKNFCLEGSPVPLALSLMCGDGFHDVLMHQAGVFDHAIGIDDRPDLLATAQTRDALPVDYHCSSPLDAIMGTLEPGSVQLVYNFLSLGAIQDLDAVVRAASRLLDQDRGVFVYVGYCGSRYGDMDFKTHAIAKRIAKTMPLLSGEQGEGVVEGCVERIESFFDFENKTSEIIESTISHFFDSITVIDLGGTITPSLLVFALENYNFSDEKFISIALLLQVMELHLIKYKVIPSNMKVIIGKKPKGSLS
ncbi:class I SAM-dependent methyltransferase [Pararhodospirillum photometricum]|uniref:class I SAM-dependent methyltransferase n=1 Tax=Pararhodospirillum photometricum TaxID=1084 RepID=UPI00030D01A4|nr:class I SAM-dependent methyltransferase [Pararhodospirillum photometricum]